MLSAKAPSSAIDTEKHAPLLFNLFKGTQTLLLCIFIIILFCQQLLLLNALCLLWKKPNPPHLQSVSPREPPTLRPYPRLQITTQPRRAHPRCPPIQAQFRYSVLRMVQELPRLSPHRAIILRPCPCAAFSPNFWSRKTGV